MLNTNDTMAAEACFDAPIDNRFGAHLEAQVCYKKS